MECMQHLVRLASKRDYTAKLRGCGGFWEGWVCVCVGGEAGGPHDCGAGWVSSPLTLGEVGAGDPPFMLPPPLFSGAKRVVQVGDRSSPYRHRWHMSEM